MSRLLAVLGRGLVPPETPVLRADDPGALRGDGAFETVHVRSGQPWLIDDHLARLARSTADLGLTMPSGLRELAFEAAAAWPEAEGALRIVLTRGGAAYVTVAPVPDKSKLARRTGVSIMTMPLPDLPFPRAKILSYAGNLAALKTAAAAGHDDALWISAEGYAVEAPTANLLWLAGGTLHTTGDSAPLLAGTTSAFVLANSRFAAATGHATVDDLRASDGVWLTSALRGLVAVTAIDGQPLEPSAATAELQHLAGYPLP